MDNDERTAILDKLERTLKYTRQMTRLENPEDPQSVEDFRQMQDVAELYRLGGLIYLHRAGRRCASSNQTLQKLVDDAFNILKRLDACERTFPLFIVSCEARTDTQRTIVLELIKRTRGCFKYNSMVRVRSFIERFWAQDDLDTEHDIDYASKLTAALSNVGTLPAFS
jgi:hypothetical protein